MKKIVLLISLISALGATAQTTSIPDPVFEQALIDLNIDTDGTVNGQMATADAEATTSLTISYMYEGGNTENYIQDVTGLEAFINLESLTLNGTMVNDLDIAALINLKYLDCVDNTLESLDVSNNVALEYLNISSGGDVYPFNWITEIDLSHNPLINELIAWGTMERIDLRNGSNNADMVIHISAIWAEYPPEVIVGNTCIEVDDAVAAQSNAYPYSEWNIYHSNMAYTYVADCTMGTPDFEKAVSVYPNPASGIFYVNNTEEGASLQIIDFSGRVVREYATVNGGVSLTGIAAGTYLVKIISGQAVHAQKIIIKS